MVNYSTNLGCWQRELWVAASTEETLFMKPIAPSRSFAMSQTILRNKLNLIVVRAHSYFTSRLKGTL